MSLKKLTMTQYFGVSPSFQNWEIGIKTNGLLSNKLFELFGISWTVFPWSLLKKRIALTIGYLFVRAGKLQRGGKEWKTMDVPLF